MIPKLLIIDVDGTLTDATVYYGDNNLELKAFNTRDGAVLKPLSALGIEVIFLTGRQSEAVSRRASDLRAVAIQGVDDKASALAEICAARNIAPQQIAYIGDDINDYAAMKLCGFKACPADAADEIKSIADYVSTFCGGHGAVRDIVEKMLKNMNKWSELLSHYNA